MKNAINSVVEFIRGIKIAKAEAAFINAVAAVTPWLAPLIPAYLVFHNMTERLGYPPIFGLVGAAAVEFLGLSAVHTAVTFWQWNDTHKLERAPFWFAFGAGLFYVVIVLTVNAALDIWPGDAWVKILAHGLLSLLSVDAAVIIAIRAQHARRLSEREEARQERRAARQDANKGKGGANIREQNANETRTDANETRTPATREEFVTAWRANGHHTIAALAAELGVKPRTAQKWIRKADKATTAIEPNN